MYNIRRKSGMLRRKENALKSVFVAYSYELVRPVDRVWGGPTPNGSWNGMLGQLQRRVSPAVSQDVGLGKGNILYFQRVKAKNMRLIFRCIRCVLMIVICRTLGSTSALFKLITGAKVDAIITFPFFTTSCCLDAIRGIINIIYVKSVLSLALHNSVQNSVMLCNVLRCILLSNRR